MKKINAIIFFVLLSTLAYAQNPLGEGRAQFNAGFGFSSWGVPVYIGLDYGISRDFTIGGEFSYRSYHDNWNSYGYDHTIMGISGNLNYHFCRILKISRGWDFYAGLNLGFFIWSSPGDYKGDHSSELGLGAQIGLRYYFSEKFAFNLEFGGGKAFFRRENRYNFKILKNFINRLIHFFNDLNSKYQINH